MSASLQPSSASVLPHVPGMELLSSLLTDATISDIFIKGTEPVVVERAGRLEETSVRFPSEEALRQMAEGIAQASGRTLDAERPILDSRLPDGSRVNVIAPPLSVDGTSISIRRFVQSRPTLEGMVASGGLSEQIAEFLKICVRCRLSTLISGSSGSGKTTLLNALSNFIDDNERVVTIEDAAELQVHKKNLVRLETHPVSHGTDPALAVTARDLVKNALRMRPDRIIIGEVRGDEAFDMMQAMNTGHEGSLATIHANHPRDALSRLENMIGMASPMPLRSIRGQLSSALHLIIQTSRGRDGVRRITYVSEVVGMEGDVITMQDLVQFVSTGEDTSGRVKGEWKWMGLNPHFSRRMAYWGEQERFNRLFNMQGGRK